MSKYTAEDARFLLFTEEEGGEVSFDEQNEEYPDEISESEYCPNQEYKKTYTELRTIKTTFHESMSDQN